MCSERGRRWRMEPRWAARWWPKTSGVVVAVFASLELRGAVRRVGGSVGGWRGRQVRGRTFATTVAGVLYGCEARQEDVESHGGQNSLLLINGVSLSVKGVGP